MRHSYSYLVEDECPHCNCDLTKPGRVKVQGVEGEFYVKDGIVAEDEFTDLILSDSNPTMTCAKCGGVLDVEPHEECG